MQDNDEIDTEWNLIGLVVSQFNNLELTMTKIISKYIQPKHERLEFVEKNLLNNSIVSFGAKVKLISAISRIEKLGSVDRDKLQRLLAIRNAIAHNDVISNIRTHIPDDPDEDIFRYIVMDRMKSDGSIETLPKSEAYGEFLMLYDEVTKQIEVVLLRANEKFA